MEDGSAVEGRPLRCRPVLGQARSVKSRGSYGLRWTDVDVEAQTISIEITRVVVDGEVVEGAPSPRPRPVCCRSSQSCWQRSGPPRACRPRSCSPPARLRAQRLRGHRPYGAALPPRHGVGLLGGRVCEGGRQTHPALHDARHTCGTLMHLEHNVPVRWPPIWTRNTVEPMRTSGTGRDSLDG